MAVKIVIFDMGGVIYDVTLWRRNIHRYISELGYRGDLKTMSYLWERFLIDVYRGKTGYDDAFRKFMLSLGFTKDEYRKIKGKSDEYRKIVEKNRQAFPGVKETLIHLKEMGIKTAILSDSELHENELEDRIMKPLGLGGIFDLIVTSRDIGVVKPDKEAYDRVLNNAGVEAQDALFVGHDREEIEGAKAAGLKTVLFNADEEGIGSDFNAREFSDIEKFVG